MSPLSDGYYWMKRRWRGWEPVWIRGEEFYLFASAGYFSYIQLGGADTQFVPMVPLDSGITE